MLYRKKVLLAVVEAFGADLGKKDFHKLLLLFCMRSGQSYYDFFPHRFGAYSFLVEQDRESLITEGVLESPVRLHNSAPGTFHEQLTLADRRIVDALSAEIGPLRGSALVRKTYLSYPFYTSRSQIADRVLSPAEFDLVQQFRYHDDSPCLFTLGYEGMSIDAYLSMLIKYDIRVLVDVRNNPISRKFGFAKTRLAECTERAGIVYHHVPELGIPSSLRRDLSDMESYRALFEHYRQNILPRQSAAIERLLALLRRHRRAAVMCFEADPRMCHRQKLVEHLAALPEFQVPIRHLSMENVGVVHEEVARLSA